MIAGCTALVLSLNEHTPFIIDREAVGGPMQLADSFSVKTEYLHKVLIRL